MHCFCKDPELHKSTWGSFEELETILLQDFQAQHQHECEDIMCVLVHPESNTEASLKRKVCNSLA